MATTLARITAYVDPELLQAFREGCLRRHISASRQLGNLLAAQVAQWQKEDTTKEQTTTAPQAG
jgi:hypothetical protein